MRIYVASSWRNIHQPGVVKMLRSDGHQVYDFKAPGDGWGLGGQGQGGFGWKEVDPKCEEWSWNIPRYIAGLKHPRAVEGFNRDMNALKASDACVMVMPCGSSASMEMGWACGAGGHLRFVAVYVAGMNEAELMVKMADLITEDVNELRQTLRMLACAQDGGQIGQVGGGAEDGREQQEQERDKRIGRQTAE